MYRDAELSDKPNSKRYRNDEPRPVDRVIAANDLSALYDLREDDVFGGDDE